MFAIGLTLAVVVLGAAALRSWVFRRERPPIDGGAVSPSWLDEHKLAKRDSSWP